MPSTRASSGSSRCGHRSTNLQAHVQRIRSSPPAEGGVPVLARDMKIYVHAEEQPFGA